MAAPILELRDLAVEFDTEEGRVRAVRGLDLAVAAGERLAIVGESGAGKSQAFLAVMGLLAAGGQASGQAIFERRDLLTLDRAALNRLRGDRLAMIFQDPMTALNPYLRVGRQLTEVLEVHALLGRRAARARAIEMLQRVQISDPARRFGQYPHELSGGMRQRVMIAMALLCAPALLIADEPTTALDVTVQAEILALFDALANETGSALVLITHDLGVVAGLCDRVAVLYAGRLVELAPAAALFGAPRHPYSAALLRAMPSLEGDPGAELEAIPGQPPSSIHEGPGCPFRPRCARAIARCATEDPALEHTGPGHLVACHVAGAAP